MKKYVIIAALLLAFNFAANAQATSTATQTVNLNLANAIEITFTGSGTATGATVNMNFNTVNDFANGVTSAEQEMKVRSNKNFTVCVSANSSNFTYTGSASPAPVMPVVGIFDLFVSSNSTGGSANTPTLSNLTVINNGLKGASQKFGVKYRATPGFSYPAGTYSLEVIYTATQL